jgi:hypothetical protein
MNASNGRRLERAALELLRSIDELYPDQEFFVIVFGYEARLMFGNSLSPRTIPATLQNKQRLRDWLSGIKTISGTDPRDALRAGLAMQPSALFLLSDGEFNSTGRPTRLFGLTTESVEQVVETANTARTPVHTIAFEDQSAEPVMRKLAESTSGIHHFVPAPDRYVRIPDVKSRTVLRRAAESYRFRGERLPEPDDSPPVAVDRTFGSRGR